VANNPYLLMEQLPDLLKAVRQYGGHLQTEVSVLTSQQPKPADQREHTEQCPAPNWEFDGSRRYRTICAGCCWPQAGRGRWTSLGAGVQWSEFDQAGAGPALLAPGFTGHGTVWGGVKDRHRSSARRPIQPAGEGGRFIHMIR
jgi:hypothetical protein